MVSEGRLQARPGTLKAFGDFGGPLGASGAAMNRAEVLRQAKDLGYWFLGP